MSKTGQTYPAGNCYRVTVGGTTNRLLSPNSSPPKVDTMTVLYGDDGVGQLFVNHHLVDPSCCQWNFDGTVLGWADRIGTSELSGQLAFAPDLRRAAGYVNMDGSAAPVMLELLDPSYIVDVSADAGASATHQGESMTLNWDPSRFDAATWSTALNWSYSVRTRKGLLGEDEYYTTVSFRDEQTQAEWQPDPLPAGGVFTLMLDADDKLVFELESGDPPADDRSMLVGNDAKVSSVFPYELVLQFDQLAQSFEGAMLVGHPDASGAAYAIRGAATNHAIVGEYAGGGARFAVRGGQLAVGGAPVADSSVTGNRLSWSGLESQFARTSGLPAEGELEFSRDGATVIGGVAPGAQRVTKPGVRGFFSCD